MQPKVGIVDSGVSPAQRAGLAACVGIVASAAGVKRVVAHDDALGHGTAVAQIILFEAPAAQLVSAQAFAGLRHADARCVAAAIDWCLEQRARIVNLSLGLATDEAVLRAACRAAIAHRAIVVAAFPARGGRAHGVEHDSGGIAVGAAALFDLGLYPAAVPAPEGQVWGEVYEMSDTDAVLAGLDDIEGYTPGHADQSLYTREQAEVLLPDGTTAPAWVYFYNAPLGQARLIASGDYLEHIRVR